VSNKTAARFKRTDEYQNLKPNLFDEPIRATVKEVFFRLKLMPASLVQYAVEQVTVIDDVVVERCVVTERDILPITLSKIEDHLLRQVQR
jgi:hypothetical protein